MAGNFRGSQFSWFSRLTGDPRKLNLRNKKPKRTRARAITGVWPSWCIPLLSWIELTAGLLHTSSLLLSFFCTNVSSLDHMLYSHAISRSLLSTSTIDHLLVFFGRFQRDLSRGARAVIGGAGRILWVEQPWNVHPRKLDREIFEDGPSTKIGSLENFRPYSNM